MVVFRYEKQPSNNSKQQQSNQLRSKQQERVTSLLSSIPQLHFFQSGWVVNQSINNQHLGQFASIIQTNKTPQQEIDKKIRIQDTRLKRMDR